MSINLGDRTRCHITPQDGHGPQCPSHESDVAKAGSVALSTTNEFRFGHLADP